MEKRTILVIDDAADVRRLLAFHLKQKYNVLEAGNGEEGLRIIDQTPPDLVILDINMPKMGGLELYRRVSSETGKPPFPIIVLTVREELGIIFRDLDVDGFITKPFNVSAVIEEVNGVIARRYDKKEEKESELSKRPAKILLVENDRNAFNNIVIAFLNAGYIVNSAKNGMEAIEKILIDLPDLILIKLGLDDIPGDIVCAKLKQMPRTMNVPVILYMPYSASLDSVVEKKICERAGTELIESNSPDILLKEVERQIKKSK